MNQSNYVFSLDHVRVLRSEHGQEGGQGPAEGRRGHQVRHPADQTRQPHVAEATLPGGEHDPEVAEERNLQLRVPHVPQHHRRKDLQ